MEKHEFKISDQGEDEGFVTGEVEINGGGIAIRFDGYSTACTQDDIGEPIWVELYDGKLRTLLWADINKEDPTHIIELDAARNIARREVPNPEMQALTEKFGGIWSEHPDYPAADWQYEVANGDTRLGYWDWVSHKKDGDE